MKDETHILPGLISQSKQAISQKVAWFYLNCLPGAVGTAEKKQSSKEVLSDANTILNQQERSLIPPASGEREAALLERGSVVKKDYLNAQLYDSIKAYAEPLRMAQGPERIRQELNRQIDRFLENTSREMREQVQFGLLRATSPSQLAKTLQEIFERRAKALNVYVCLYYERSAWQQLLESTRDYQVKYQFIVDDGACPACKQHQNVTYTYQQLMDKNLLPAIHPHCGCRLVPVGNVLDSHPQLKTNWYDPILRIPDDFKEMMEQFWTAQQQRLEAGNESGNYLDWATLGFFSGIWNSLRQNAEQMLKEPNFETILNWLTLGLTGLIKRSLMPEEPLSLEHWLNSFYLASVITGVSQTAKAVQAQRAGVPKSGAGKINRNSGVGNSVKIEGRGSTGRVSPKNLNEQMIMHEVQSNPLPGAIKVPLTLQDSRWPISEGWIKMQKTSTLLDGSKVTIHFNYNVRTGAFDDFKYIGGKNGR